MLDLQPRAIEQVAIQSVLGNPNRPPTEEHPHSAVEASWRPFLQYVSLSRIGFWPLDVEVHRTCLSQTGINISTSFVSMALRRREPWTRPSSLQYFIFCLDSWIISHLRCIIVITFLPRKLHREPYMRDPGYPRGPLDRIPPEAKDGIDRPRSNNLLRQGEISTGPGITRLDSKGQSKIGPLNQVVFPIPRMPVPGHPRFGPLCVAFLVSCDYLIQIRRAARRIGIMP